MGKLPRSWVIGLLLVGLVFPLGPSAQPGTAGKEKDEFIAADQLTKVYAENAADFNKQFKGKTLTVEGVVTGSGVKGSPPGRTYLMIQGYKKPGDPVAHSVRCEEAGPDFEGIRQGHKVRIRGVVQAHSDTLLAAELRECKVIKVFADDYPPSKAARAEVKKLQGRWKVLSAEANGKKLVGKEAGFDALSFEGYSIYLYQGDKAFSFGIVLDPEKTPKIADLVGGRVPLPCIYALEGDQLTLCLPGQTKAGFVRPATFDSRKHQGHLLKAERQKEKGS